MLLIPYAWGVRSSFVLGNIFEIYENATIKLNYCKKGAIFAE